MNSNRLCSWLFFLCFTGFTTPALSQKTVDSLRILLENHPQEDSVRAELLNQLAVNALASGANSELRAYASGLEILGRKTNSPLFLVRGNTMLGVSYSREGVDLAKALEYYRKALDIAQSQQGDTWRNREAQIFMNISSVYMAEADYPEALNFCGRAAAIYGTLRDSSGLAKNLWSRGIILSEAAQLDASRRAYETAKTIFVKTRDTLNAAIMTGMIGRIHFQQGRFREALSCVEVFLAATDSLDSAEHYTEALTTAGQIYIALGQWDDAERHLLTGLRIARQIGISATELLHKTLAELYEKTRRPQVALKHLRSYMVLHDERTNKERAKQLEREKVKFQIAEKEQQLSKMRELQLASEARIWLFGWMMVSIFLILLIIAWFYRLSRRKNRLIAEQNKFLDASRQILETKHLELQTLMQEKKNLVSLLAHHLRSPLGLIRINATILKSRPDTPKGLQPPIAEIDHAAQKIDKLLRQIIRVENWEDEAAIAKFDAVGLEQIVRTSMQEFSDLAQQKEVTFQFTNSAAGGAVWGDAFILQFILNNILSNALNFSPAGKPVKISMESDQESVRIEVTDYGPGIPFADQDRIFEKYFRGNNAAEGDDSLGIGLYLTRIYMEQHKGSIDVQSVQGFGTTVRCSFPLLRTA